MARESIKYIAPLVLALLVFGMMAAPAAAPAPPLSLADIGTVYGPLCGGYASDTCPYFTLNVVVIDTGNGVNSSNVTVDVSRWNSTPSGILLMNPNGTSGANYNFSLNVTVDKVVRGTYNATVTAYNNIGDPGTTNLSVEAHIQPGLSVVGYNSSKSYPAYPTFVSMFYNNSPIVMIINTTDATQYTNITVDFSGVDGSPSLEYNNSGVLLPDGTNYTYRIIHNLGTIPTNDVRTAWVNATFSTQGGPITIPQMASLVIVSNINPINMSMGLGGATTNWPDILDYTNAYLTFEAVNATNGFKVATLTFNDPINLTNRATAMNLSLLGQKLSIAGSSMSLSGAADALVAFNKSANLTIYNLTNFATSPAIFADGVLIALPGHSSGGAAANISWNQTAQSLTLNVSHWTSYSWGTYGVNLTNISALSNTTITATNATYTFILQNNGTLADSYNLTISNPDTASVAALNISGNITLAANAIQSLQLNVTNTIAGTFHVNVTATSVNFSNRTGSINTTTTVNAVRAVNLTVASGAKTTNASANATYTLTLQNNGTDPDSYNLTIDNPDHASVAALNTSGNITLAVNVVQTVLLNVTNTTSGTFRVNVTAISVNDSSKLMYINTTTTVPIVITITNPADGSVNDTGSVNVTVTLDNNGTAKYLNWNGVNNTMTPTTSQPAGTVFSMNMTGLLSGNHSFKVFANDSNGLMNVSETRIVTVNRTIVNTTIGSVINLSTFITNATLEISAPSGNVTITIPNGTNASVGGAALAYISTDSLAQVNSTFTLGSSDRWVGENISMGPEGARFSPDIQIRFNYTDDEWRAAGITDESQLKVRFYNTSATPNAWETPTQSQDKTLNYILVNLSHFSTFALLGTTTTSGGGGGGGSSSGTGGGGIVTAEPYDNIAKSESYDKDLTADAPVTYTFKAPELGVYEIAFTGKENENGITLRVEVLKATSKKVTVQAPGTVYKNINILAGTKRMKEALVRFKIENSWLGSNNLAGSDVKMLHWDGSQWTQLETTQTAKDDTYTSFEAKTDALSPFAISGLKGGVIVPTATPAGAVTGTPVVPTGTGTPAPAPTKKVPAFEFVLTIAILSVSYLFGRKRR
jgi:PGF-pre-PGF domain-containing protein